jgi:uncharacterized membrane protein YeaQ/YmgE (transglycosylase-associated protein family)
MEILGINVINIILWLALGFVAGMIIHLVDPGDAKGGILATTLFGIIGAVVGGFLTSLFFGLHITGFNFQSILIALAGGAIVALVHRLLMRKNEHIKTPTEKLE